MNMIIVKEAIESTITAGLTVEERVSLTVNLTNCCESLKAAALMEDDQRLYDLSFAVVGQIYGLDGNELNDVTHTVWNILCWLRQSMGSLIYKKFDLVDIVKHDLTRVPLDKIFSSLDHSLVDYFVEPKHYGQAMRYLQVLNQAIVGNCSV